MSFEQAAAIPVAGLTALRSLEIGGFVLGKRVLVTGASGGVGRFAIQLAKLAGRACHGDRAACRGPCRARRRRGGARGARARGPNFDVILDAVGGPCSAPRCSRSRRWARSSASPRPLTEPVTYPTRELFARAPGALLYGLYIFSELDRTGSGSADLRRLADLVAAGRLDPQIDMIRSWRDAGEAIEALLDRRVAGKAVLTVD